MCIREIKQCSLNVKEPQCNLCDKKLDLKSDAVKQMRVHTSEKPCIHQQCNFACVQSDNLNNIQNFVIDSELLLAIFQANTKPKDIFTIINVFNPFTVSVFSAKFEFSYL